MGKQRSGLYRWVGVLLATAALHAPSEAQTPQVVPATWTPTGWGGGGFYYAAAFHPTKDGVIYLGGDVNGMYKSEDHGRHWRIINDGIANYGVFSIAVDPSNPDTVYAATEGGLCKSTDAGEHWQLLPETHRKALRITGEKGKSVRSVAVNPTDGNTIYAGNPLGKIYKSSDGGQSWKLAYQKQQEVDPVASVRVQFGKVTGDFFSGIWLPLEFPKDAKSQDCVGFGFSFKGDGTEPRDVFATIKLASGAAYRSRNLRDIFGTPQWTDVVLRANDFVIDPEYKKKKPDVSAALSQADWASVNRVDFSVVGDLPNQASVGRFGRFFFAFANEAESPVLVTARDFAQSKTLQSYGNVRTGDSAGAAVYSVTVAPKDPSIVAAATGDAGVVLSEDAGATWRELPTPKKASSVVISSADSNVLYGTFFTDGVWKSADRGQTWTNLSEGLDKKFAVKEVVISPANPQDVYLIGAIDWGGSFYYSNNGGETWTKSSAVKADPDGNPTLPAEGGAQRVVPLSIPTNLAINPKNPKELYISANWRSVISDDAGKSWEERAQGMDISCVTDIRFHNGKTYVSAMDEGVLVSEDNGAKWQQLWPMKHSDRLSGHYWRLAIDTIGGKDRIISTSSPWANVPNQIVLSEDGGKNFAPVSAGLPDYIPTPNTMWGRGYARALAVDPKDPSIVYMGIDGDPSSGKSGGGLFKSTDGGQSWKQLPNQPASRRMFFGLAVDPTNSKRLFWATCGTNGGLHRSEDGGETWKAVFTKDQWVFNVLVTEDGTIYCPGKELYRSDDHGNTWKQISKLNFEGSIVGLEVHPKDPKTIWMSHTTWDGAANGGVYKTTDGGATWQNITGDLPYRKPLLLRFNAATNELWAGGVGLYRLKSE